MSQEITPSDATSTDSVRDRAITHAGDVSEVILFDNDSGHDAGGSEHKCAQCAGQSAEGEETVTHEPSERVGQSASLVAEPELISAVNALTKVALQMEDPVQALEEGVEALAEALVARQLAAQQQEHEQRSSARQREADLAEWQGAYRHARLHRVGELVDVGYSLDQAAGIANANEAEIRRRAWSAGRDPNAVIYEYAVRHGYQRRSVREEGRVAPETRRTSVVPARSLSVLEKLAGLSDEAFAQATQGDRWQRLLKVQ